MAAAYICDGIRTPFGRYNGTSARVRDDLAALTLKALTGRHPELGADAIDDVVLGCANQAGGDNRNVARMAALLAGFPASVPGVTVSHALGCTISPVRGLRKRWLEFLRDPVNDAWCQLI